MDNDFSIEFRFWIKYKDEAFFGKGKIDLLLKIRQLGSLKQAAEALNMSYRKAYYSIDQINKITGQKMVNMKRGGKNGGTTELTPYCIELIETYQKLDQEIKAFIASKTF